MKNVSTPVAKQHSPLNLKDKLSQRTIVERFNEIDWEKGSFAPIVVEFDPTTACNLACPDCISRELLNQGFFSRERIRYLTKEMVDAGVKAVVLIGGGEPLAHPEIGWVIDYLGRNNVQIGITTNGLLIDRHIDVIAKYANWVRVSIDAGTPETFHIIRPSFSGKSEFPKAVRNMKMLAKVKTGKLGYSFMIYSDGKFDETTDSFKPKGKSKKGIKEVMEASYMAMEMIKSKNNNKEFSNVSEIYQAAKLAKEIGCDYFEVKPMYDINHFAIPQREKLMEKTLEMINGSLELEDDNFKILKATKLKHILRGEPNIEPKDYNRCAVSEFRTLVTPSGTYVCPYFRGRADKKIGDVNNMSFEDMWRGEQRKKVINVLNPSVDCRMHCIRHESNLILEDMIAGNKDIKVLDDFDLFI